MNLKNLFPNTWLCRHADDCTLDELVGSGKDSHVQEVLNSMGGWAQEMKCHLILKRPRICGSALRKQFQNHLNYGLIEQLLKE